MKLLFTNILATGNSIKTMEYQFFWWRVFATDLYGNVYALSAPQVKGFTTNGYFNKSLEQC